jgi:FkbM family methyltransferase
MGSCVSNPNDNWPVEECAGFRFYVPNHEEFARICQDVVDGHEYVFRTRRPRPYIIDAGAHVGVATHDFKRRYPRARVLAVEANPATVELLRRNIAHNGLEDVRVLHAALAPERGEIPFYTGADGARASSWGDSVIRQPWHEGGTAAVVQVPAVPLSALLTEPVDLLKLDVEGVETVVLAEAAHRLHLVRQIVLEYHGARANPDNDIGRLVATLEEAGLTVELFQHGSRVSIPTIERSDPYWLAVRAARLDPLQRARRALASRGFG